MRFWWVISSQYQREILHDFKIQKRSQMHKKTFLSLQASCESLQSSSIRSNKVQWPTIVLYVGYIVTYRKQISSMFNNGGISWPCPANWISGTSSDSQKCRSDMVATAPWSAMERHWATVPKVSSEIRNTLQPHDLKTKFCVASPKNKGGCLKTWAEFSWTRTPLWSFFGWLVYIHLSWSPDIAQPHESLLNLSACRGLGSKQIWISNLAIWICNLHWAKKKRWFPALRLGGKMPWCLSNLIHLTTQWLSCSRYTSKLQANQSTPSLPCPAC